MAEEFRVLRPYEYHSQLIAKGNRVDERKLEEFREIKLETDAIKTADSSSLVKLGNTSLVCGCTANVLKFKDDADDNEEIKIRIEMPPVCYSPYGNKTQITAQLLTRTLKGILDDMNCIEKSSLHNEEDDTYWSVDVEVICLNYDGSLLDAAIIAVLAVLKSLRLKTKNSTTPDRYIRFNTIPIISSFALIGDRIISDPSLEEETIAQSTFSITVDTNSEQNFHVSKIGGKSLSSQNLFKCLKISSKRAEAVLSALFGLDNKNKMDIT